MKITSQEEEEAIKMANLFYRGSVFGKDKKSHEKEKEEAKLSAFTCVEYIKKALKETTDHLNLEGLDYEGVKNDFVFWDKVSGEIQDL